MRTCLLVLAILVAVPSPVHSAPDRAEQAYQAARRGYYALKDDAKRRRFRHNWLNVAERFEQVARRHPKSARAPDALYTAAELRQELSRISMLDEDRAAAAKNFEELVEKYPTNRLADDAALALARFELEQRGRPARAREVLSAALARLPRGDQARELRSLLSRIPEVEAPRSVPRQIAARSAQPGPAPVAEEPAAEPRSTREALAEAFARTARAPQESSSEAEPAPTAPAAASPVPAQEKVAANVEVAVEPSEARPAEPEPKPAAPAPPAPVAPRWASQEAKKTLKEAAKIREREVTLAEQLGLKVRRVVIDPGHGGHDSGAVGKKGTLEKDVALEISRQLAELLADKGFEVVLTRDDDQFIRLEDRARIANEFKGDLFISVHCNSAPNRKRRGVETYTLNLAADRYSIRLAARENSSSEKGMNDLQFILADLATKANTEESQRLASRIQKALVGGLSDRYPDIKDLGTKQALFYVLLGVRMPAVLVETSFISHPDEERRLASGEYQRAIARSIASGVEDFLGSRLARVR